jgi:gluconolactonase
MRRLLVLALAVIALAGTFAVHGQEGTGPFGNIIRKDARLDALIPADAKLEKLAVGFKWAEGPVWVKDHLLFSDIPNNAIHMWTPGKGLTRDYIKPSGYTGTIPRGGEPGSNGLMLDAEGRLVCCEHGDRRVTRIEKDGTKTVLADKYMGKRFNSPNDLVYSKAGDLYFTDPPYGMVKNWDDPARELDFCGVFRLKKDGTLELVTKELSRPNGITLSPDEKTLYVGNSDPKAAIWKKYPVNTDGSIGAGTLFADVTAEVGKKPGLPDGMKTDVKGNIFATGPGGVFVFAPDATVLGILDTGVPTANCAFGDDGSTLYIAANDSLAKIKTTTKGRGF